jgi:hypothetical protein
MNYRATFSVLFYLLIAFGMSGAAQESPSSQTRSHHPTFRGQYDTDISIPEVEGVPGEKDPAALKELDSAAGVSIPTDWLGIQVEGRLRVGVHADAQDVPAKLVIRRGARLEFDISDSNASSIRVNAGLRFVLHGDQVIGTQQTSLLGGPFWASFQLLESSRLPEVSVIDDGIMAIEGQQLHRITMVAPKKPELSSQSRMPSTRFATSFYFDPTSHLLVKSVCVAELMNNPAQRTLQVITYSDYRVSQGVSLPFRYTETDNGQLSFEFQAQTVSGSNGHDSSYFHF